VVWGVKGIMMGGFVPVGGGVCMGVCMRCKYICVAGFWQNLVGSGRVSRAMFISASFRSASVRSEGYCPPAGGGGYVSSGAPSTSNLLVMCRSPWWLASGCVHVSTVYIPRE
jgi:hypothetical protein